MGSKQYSVDSGQYAGEGRTLAERVREACLQTAIAAYEDARMSGLCHEGAWECAVDAIRTLNIGLLFEPGT